MVTVSNSRVLAATDPEWSDALSRLRHDVYHTQMYHGVPGFGREGEAFAYLYREGDQEFLWPYLLKPITDTGYFDVTSVYGYAGPVSSPDTDFAERAWRGLLEAWRDQRAVSAFTRFHPMLANHKLLEGAADADGRSAAEGLRFCGSTVSVDLTLSLDEQLARYQKVHRQAVRKGYRLGLHTELDEDWHHADDFVSLYRASMARLNSRPEYLIDRPWLDEFRRLLGDHTRLFVTKLDGVVAAASLTMVYPPFLHPHLIGSNPELVEYSPIKVALDAERIWGTEQGLEAYHLGGGVGGREDGLFQSKRKFSPVTHEFFVGSWILNCPVYRELEAEHRRKLGEQGVEIADLAFFPIYRYQPGPVS